MRSLFSLIARAISATATVLTTVWRFCRKTGRWIGETVAKTVGAVTGSPGREIASTVVSDNEDAIDLLTRQSQALAESIEPPTVDGGDTFDAIQRVCRNLCSEEGPLSHDLNSLTPLQREWIELLSPAMRFIVGNEERTAVMSHLHGGKGLRGVIRCDAESISQWRNLPISKSENDQMVATEARNLGQETDLAVRHMG